MKLQVHSIHFNADSKLITFIQKKLDKLETFYDRMVDGEVFLRLNNEGIENKTVEIKLRVPGNQLFSRGISQICFYTSVNQHGVTRLAFISNK